MLAESSQKLTILHSYPEPGNFSYVRLECVVSGSIQLVNDSIQFSSVVSGARFQLNGTDIGVTINGILRLLLTQEKEGFFTCSHNESISSNSIGLAGKIGVILNIPPITTLFSPQLNQEHSLTLPQYIN